MSLIPAGRYHYPFPRRGEKKEAEMKRRVRKSTPVLSLSSKKKRGEAKEGEGEGDLGAKVCILRSVELARRYNVQEKGGGRKERRDMRISRFGVTL